MFYSNSDGTPNVDDMFITVEGVFRYSGGFNLAALELIFGGSSEFANSISDYHLGVNGSEASRCNVIDGEINTHTTFGTANNSNCMSITVGSKPTANR